MFAIIIVGKTFLIPIILAVALWFVINALNNVLRNIPLIEKIPKALTLVLSSLVIVMMIYWTGRLIADNINRLIEIAPDYQMNFEQQAARIAGALGYSGSLSLENLSAEMNFGEYLGRILNSFTSIAQNFLLIILYTVFLLIEQNTFPRKLAALRLEKERKQKVTTILEGTNKAIRSYIGVKFTTSLSTAIISYLIIASTGLEFALFWAFLIFVLNFIPSIGSIVATLFPSMVALIQFESLQPFLIILLGVGAVQFTIGSILEPRIFGSSLNISPFVVLLSLILWGLLWGIAGMLLCVPITVILMIIFSQFPSTRPIAVLLSRNGRLKD